MLQMPSIQKIRWHFFTIQKYLPININIYQQLRLVTDRSLYSRWEIHQIRRWNNTGDPTAIAIYAFGIKPLLAWLSKISNGSNSASASKQVTFADDLNGLGTLESLKKWWSLLEEEGKKIGYNVNTKKSYLIVKAKEIFEDTNFKR